MLDELALFLRAEFFNKCDDLCETCCLHAFILPGSNVPLWEYRKIKRPFPPPARAHPVAHPAPPGTTSRRASAREAAWAWQAVRKLAAKSCQLRPRRLVQTSGTVRYRLAARR